MSWISAVAIYFIIWWTVLFAMLPLRVRTQDDKKDVTLGTVASAPHGSHMLGAALLTTAVSALLFGLFFYLTRVLGLTIDSIPRIVPEF